MYFNRFPIIYYEFDINGERVLKLVRDVTLNIRIQKAVLENIVLYDEYDIKEGDTPEIIAAKVYGSPLYHWVVMLCNQRYDYIEDFPLSSRDLIEYCNDKYENIDGTHHYVLAGTDYIVSFDPLDPNKPYSLQEVEPVTNFEYEDRLNESKRRIRLISPSMLQKVVSQFKGII
jgi:hypothetical protein